MSHFPKSYGCKPMFKQPSLTNALKILNGQNGHRDNVRLIILACFWIQLYPKNEDSIKLVDKHIINQADMNKPLIMKMLDTKRFDIDLINEFLISNYDVDTNINVLHDIDVIMEHIHIHSDLYSDEDVKRVLKEIVYPCLERLKSDHMASMDTLNKILQRLYVTIYRYSNDKYGLLKVKRFFDNRLFDQQLIDEFFELLKLLAKKENGSIGRVIYVDL